MNKGQGKGARKSVPGRGDDTSQSLGHEREHGGFEEMRAVRFGQKTETQPGKYGKAEAGW